jgi:hypothetical protein
VPTPSFLAGDEPRWWEVKLVEEQAQCLYSFDGRDLPVKLEEICDYVAGVESECATENVQLSCSVMEISDALVDLGVFPIWDIPERPKSAQDVLTVADLILERPREEHATNAGSWV